MAHADAVVLEDAVSGVRAGAAGGFALTIGVDRGAGHDTLRDAGADVVVSDLARAGLVRPRRGTSPATRWTATASPSTPGAWSRPGTTRDDLGLTETLFTVGNGYLGMRGNPDEGRDAYAHGTFINGFHETWPIRHAEAAFGFARTGQTIVNVPDAKVLKLYVDDEPLNLVSADLESYERVLDLREGLLRRSLVWRTPSGKRVKVESTRMVSMHQRHLAVLTLEVTMLSGDAPIVISSQLLNRQDGKDEYHVASAAMGEGHDPRKAQGFEDRVLLPRMSYAEDDRLGLGYVCAQLEDDRRRRRRPPDRVQHPGRAGQPPRRRPGQARHPHRAPRGRHAARREAGRLPLLARRAGA